LKLICLGSFGISKEEGYPRCFVLFPGRCAALGFFYVAALRWASFMSRRCAARRACGSKELFFSLRGTA
jgi:hypothetical protein